MRFIETLVETPVKIITRYTRPPTRVTSHLVLGVVVLLLAACGSDPGFDENIDFIPAEGSVRFVNLIPDSPSLTVIHGFRDQFQARFGIAEPIETRFEDRYDWRIAYLDGNGNDVTVAEEDDQQISENVLSTFLIMGTIALPNIVITEINGVSADQRPLGMAEVWFASNSSNQAMVDIYLIAFGSGIDTQAPLTTLNSGSASELLSVNAGVEKQLIVTVAGTQTILFDSGSITVTERTVELFAVIDDFGPSSTSHVDVIRSLSTTNLTMADNSQLAQARVGNFSSVDLINAIFGGVTHESIDATGLSQYQTTSQGAQSLTVTDSSDDRPLEDTSLTNTQGAFNTIYSFTDPDPDSDLNNNLRSLIVTDNQRSLVSHSIVNFVNGSDQLVDFFILRDGQTTTNTAPVLSGVSFSSGTETEVPARQIEFVVTSDADGTTLSSMSVNLQERTSRTIIFDSQGVLHDIN
jgi:hypothetical protein